MGLKKRKSFAGWGKKPGFQERAAAYRAVAQAPSGKKKRQLG